MQVSDADSFRPHAIIIPYWYGYVVHSRLTYTRDCCCTYFVGTNATHHYYFCCYDRHDTGGSFTTYHEFDACKFDVRFDYERSVDAECQVGESHRTNRRLEHHAGGPDGQARVIGAREVCIRDGHLRLSLAVNHCKFFTTGDVYRARARSDRTQKCSSELHSLHRSRGHGVLFVQPRTDSSVLESARVVVVVGWANVSRTEIEKRK